MILKTVTLEGLHFRKQGKGGAYRADLPFTPEADAFAERWDAETLTLTYYTPNEPEEDGTPVDPTEHSRTITQAEIDAGIAEVTTPKPAPVPEKVTQRQLRLATSRAGIDLSALIASLPDGQAKTEAQIELEYASYILRDAPLVSSLAALAGLDDAALDSLFIAAGNIPTDF